MVVLVTCNYEEDPIKNEGARVLTRLYVNFSDAQGQLTLKSAAEFCLNSNISKLLLSFLPARMKKIQSKLKELARVLTRFSPLYVYGIVFRRSRVANSAVLDRI